MPGSDAGSDISLPSSCPGLLSDAGAESEVELPPDVGSDAESDVESESGESDVELPPDVGICKCARHCAKNVPVEVVDRVRANYEKRSQSQQLQAKFDAVRMQMAAQGALPSDAQARHKKKICWV